MLLKKEKVNALFSLPAGLVWTSSFQKIWRLRRWGFALLGEACEINSFTAGPWAQASEHLLTISACESGKSWGERIPWSWRGCVETHHCLCALSHQNGAQRPEKGSQQTRRDLATGRSSQDLTACAGGDQPVLWSQCNFMDWKGANHLSLPLCGPGGQAGEGPQVMRLPRSD